MEAQLGIVVGIVGIIYAAILYAWIKKSPDGTDRMREIAEMIHRGAMAFLRREYASLGVFVAVLFIVLTLAIGHETGVAFLAGALSSMLATGRPIARISFSRGRSFRTISSSTKRSSSFGRTRRGHSSVTAHGHRRTACGPCPTTSRPWTRSKANRGRRKPRCSLEWSG